MKAAKAMNSVWPTTTIARSSYLRGRIGWQGLRAAEFLDEGPYLVTGTDFVDGKINWDHCYHVSEERYAEAEYIHIKDGDLLITKDGTIGKVAFVEACPDKAVLNSGIFLLRCNDGSYVHEYVYHLLRSHVFHKFLKDNLAGSTIKHLYQHVFQNFEFSVPEPEEQTKIAEILSTVDRAIEQTEAIITKQQRIKTGLMQDLLTRGIDEHGNLRSEETHEFKDSPLGRVPEGWEVKSLEGLMKAVVDCPHTTPAFTQDGILVARTFNIKDGKFIGEQSYVSATEYSERVSRLEPQQRDVIFTREAPVGEAYVIPVNFKVCLGQRTMLLRCDLSECLPEYFIEVVYSEEMRNRFDQKVGGTTNPHLNVSDVRALAIKKPSINEQKKIASLLNEVRSALESYIREAKKLRSLKTALMQDMLTGKKRVTALVNDMEVVHG